MRNIIITGCMTPWKLRTRQSLAIECILMSTVYRFILLILCMIVNIIHPCTPIYERLKGHLLQILRKPPHIDHRLHCLYMIYGFIIKHTCLSQLMVEQETFKRELKLSSISWFESYLWKFSPRNLGVPPTQLYNRFSIKYANFHAIIYPIYHLLHPLYVCHDVCKLWRD